MIKVAFFVEGQTEFIFIERLLNEYLKNKYYKIAKSINMNELYKELEIKEIDKGLDYYFLIYNVSGNDDTVVSKISDIGNDFVEKYGYHKIIGVCDLLKKGIKRQDKKKRLNFITETINAKCHYSDKISIVMAIMEIESWFLADHNMFSKIDATLTPEYIKKEMKIDLENDDPEEDYNKPAKLVDKIYNLAGKRYKKRQKQSYKIAHSINYDYLYLETRGKKISAFHLLIDILEKTI
jgi:hypothetical protein